MKTLKRSECAVLPLVLKKKWYDMIASGEKEEEYRDATPYWSVRIGNWIRQNPPQKTVVAFSRGYRKPTMFFLAYTWPDVPWFPEAVKEREDAHPVWGEPASPHYVIRLYCRVELED